MPWKSRNPEGGFTLRESIEIDAEVEQVFAHWVRYEDFPVFMHHVRRTRRIDDRHVLWDVDVAGRQVVWEARILEVVPEKLVRWESGWGPSNSGQVCFESLPDSRTRLTAEIELRPRGLLESLAARLGVVDRHVREDLQRFRRFIQSLPPHDSDEAG